MVSLKWRALQLDVVELKICKFEKLQDVKLFAVFQLSEKCIAQDIIRFIVIADQRNI